MKKRSQSVDQIDDNKLMAGSTLSLVVSRFETQIGVYRRQNQEKMMAVSESETKIDRR